MPSPGPTSVAFLVGFLLLSCNGGEQSSDELVSCVTFDASADVDVSGIFEYSGVFQFLLRGTITLEQEGATVRVTDTTYENAFDRALEGEGTLEGNRLGITLVPKNGETDYSAEVIFLFGEDGETFCVEFDDTNGDAGPMGTYRGRRITR